MDDLPEFVPMSDDAFSYAQIQQLFEKSFFMVADKQLRNIALKAYSSEGRDQKQYRTSSIESALNALEGRSLAWISYPKEAAMQHPKQTIREFIKDIQDVLAPISYAAETLKPHLYEQRGNRTFAAAYFASLQKRLEGRMHTAESFLKNGEMVIVANEEKFEQDGVFGVMVKDTLSQHLFALHAILGFDDGFMKSTQELLDNSNLSTPHRALLMEDLSKLTVAVIAYAKNDGMDRKSALIRSNMLRTISEIAPEICGLIEGARNSPGLLESDEIQATLMEIVGENLAAVRDIHLRGR